jgi:hypothetical protein
MYIQALRPGPINFKGEEYEAMEASPISSSGKGCPGNIAMTLLHLWTCA